MTIFIMERVPIGLRGELSRWLIEPHVGVFVGKISALVRDKLWEMCCDASDGGGVILLWSTNTEQKFDIRTYGDTKRDIVDYDGIHLVRRPHA